MKVFSLKSYTDSIYGLHKNRDYKFQAKVRRKRWTVIKVVFNVTQYWKYAMLKAQRSWPRSLFL